MVARGALICRLINDRPLVVGTFVSFEYNWLSLHREACAGALPDASALQLAAGRHDVTAARRAHRARIAGAVHHLGEFLDLLPVRALIGGVGPAIERDQ